MHASRLQRHNQAGYQKVKVYRAMSGSVVAVEVLTGVD
jgi:hypothetical protein